MEQTIYINHQLQLKKNIKKIYTFSIKIKITVEMSNLNTHTHNQLNKLLNDQASFVLKKKKKHNFQLAKTHMKFHKKKFFDFYFSFFFFLTTLFL